MKKQKSRQSILEGGEQQESERVKLIRLVQVWRTKYEKLYSTSQGFDDIIQGLTRDNEQLKKEKETVSKDLQEKLQAHRAESEVKISELLAIADTAAKQNEVETRDLRTKLRRLEVETQPIIDMYKERDDKFQRKVEKLENQNTELRCEKEELLARWEKADIQRMEEISELKRNHRRSFIQLKMQHAMNLATKLKITRAQVETEAQEYRQKEEKPIAVRVTEEEQEKKDNEVIKRLQEEIELIKKEKRLEVLELRAKMTEIAREKKRVVEEYCAEMMKQRKRAELGRLRTKQREETIKYLKTVIVDANKQLSIDRTRRKTLRKTSLSVKELSRLLVVTIKETRSIERALKRQDIIKNHSGFFEVDDILKLEVLYSSKISEVTRLRRLIHEKLIEEIYSPRSSEPRDKLTPKIRPSTFTPKEGNNSDSDNEDEIVFLKSGYGSDSDSETFYVGERYDSESHDEEVAQQKVDMIKKRNTQHPVQLTDRTSWLLAAKHNSTIELSR